MTNKKRILFFFYKIKIHVNHKIDNFLCFFFIFSTKQKKKVEYTLDDNVGLKFFFLEIIMIELKTK
jgi:hypothetical protein